MGERMKMQMAKKQKQESSKKNRWRLEKRERCWKAEKMNELRKYSSIGDWKAKLDVARRWVGAGNLHF